MLRKTFVVLLVLVSLFLAPGRGYGLEARIADFLINTSEKDLLVHFKVKDCFTKKMEEAVLAGIPTTFTFFLELHRERDFWFDSRLVSGVTRHTIKYDTVKKIFYVTFSGNGRAPLEFTDFAAAKKAMEEVNAAALSPLSQLIRGGRYYVKVKAKLDKVRLPLSMEYVFFFVSLWDFETKWERKDFVYK
jgi:hypothetical protein